MSHPIGERQPDEFKQQELLRTAGEAVEDLLVDDDFLAACDSVHIDARVGHPNFKPGEFWAFAANYARKPVRSEVEDGEIRSVESLLSELAIAFPSYVLDTQTSRDPQRRRLITYDEMMAASDRIHHYYELIQALAEAEPRISVKGLGEHLGTIGTNMLMQRNVVPDAHAVAATAMRGMQSELTFKHAMHAAGRRIEPASQEQDFLGGVDYYFFAASGALIGVDVKASTDKLDAMRGEATTSNELFAIDWGRNRVLISPLTGGRGQRSDRFFLEGQQSAILGHALAEALDKAAYRLAHPNIFRALG